jgi:LysM repeat protein
LNEEKRAAFYQSETFKTLLTILVILLIPVAAFAWNFFTGRDGMNQLRQAFNIAPSNNDNTDGTANDNNDELAQNNQGDVQGDANKDQPNQTNGKPNTLPNTSSKFTYTVKKGDTVESISRAKCEDLSYFANNSNLVVKEGQKITVNCD